MEVVAKPYGRANHTGKASPGDKEADLGADKTGERGRPSINTRLISRLICVISNYD